MRLRILMMAILAVFIISSISTIYADVKYVGEDKKTLGNWPEKYGKNGAVIFKPGGDSKDLKDIIKVTDNGQRWDWANPTQDERGLFFPDDLKKRTGSCMFNNPVGLVELETKLKSYQVAISAIDWDSSVRVEDLVGYQGDKAPKDPDVTVQNPDFHNGVYYIWHVTGNDPFKLQITHKGGANWVISGLFVDAVGASVNANGKLTMTWGSIKK
ncbi:TPA: hypothetical protein ENS27_14055 [bacterium]|nr:hypothetical protein [bacterium]